VGDDIHVEAAVWPSLDGALAWLSAREPAAVLAGASLRDQAAGGLPTIVLAVGVRESRSATPGLADAVRRRLVAHNHDFEVGSQFRSARVSRTEYGDLLSAKASVGPIPAVKAVAWAVHGVVSGVVPAEAAAIW
jgi:hypothetical protein